MHEDFGLAPVFYVREVLERRRWYVAVIGIYQARLALADCRQTFASLDSLATALETHLRNPQKQSTRFGACKIARYLGVLGRHPTRDRTLPAVLA